MVAMFTRAREAVAAALDGQRGVLAEEWPIGAELRVRMALHTGAARLRDEGDDFAAAVMRCARCGRSLMAVRCCCRARRLSS